MLNRINEALRRFMYGRYGIDQLSLALLAVAMVSSLLAGLRNSSFIFNLLYLVAIVLCFYRILSRDCTRRSDENRRFMGQWMRLVGKFRGSKSEMGQRKNYCLFKCPKCGQKLRLPKGKGMVEVTCVKCGTKFQKKT